MHPSLNTAKGIATKRKKVENKQKIPRYVKGEKEAVIIDKCYQHCVRELDKCDSKYRYEI